MIKNNLEVKKLAFKMRKKALEMALKVGNKGSHLGPAFSCMEVLASLYGSVMVAGLDRFIPSKAHCVLAYYTALAYAGYMPIEVLDTFEDDDSELAGHPVAKAAWGIEFSGGSLGMGLSQGVGLALASKRINNNAKIYVLVGDGECNEGSIWEAIMSAAQFKLDNLVMIVDSNKLQYDGEVKNIMNISPLEDKLKSFGWNVNTIKNGNDVDQVLSCFDNLKIEKSCPIAIIANTTKGAGVSFMENKKEWHHSRITPEQFSVAMEELLGRENSDI